jgi:UDP-N-acetylglucosamine--N-acetylmuramyl-(pentapeptide) pyrophosphoryl-undecaprenol N-acetylglucosamine transferase
MFSPTAREILISAGASGGHIFPALAVGRQLRAQVPAIVLRWVGTHRSREAQLCSQFDIAFTALNVAGMPTRFNPVAYVKQLILFVRAVYTISSLMKRRRPECVISFGGYVCAPVLLAALVHKVPYYIQEQNTVAGKVNRLFSRWARCSFLGFEDDGTMRIHGRKEVSGNPIRTGYLDDTAAVPSGIDTAMTTLFICGGSQGALSMNRCLVDDIARFTTQRGLQLIWQTGNVAYAEIAERFKANPRVFVYASIEDPYVFYDITTVLICRAGAMSLAEAGYFAIPVIMVPLPWATGNHQWKNAARIETQGWGVRVAQNENTGPAVIACLERMLDETAYYAMMKENARKHARVNGARHIVATVCKERGW